MSTRLVDDIKSVVLYTLGQQKKNIAIHWIIYLNNIQFIMSGHN